jgi:uncharacterized protein
MRAIGLAKILSFYTALFVVSLLAMWRMDRLGRLAPAIDDWRATGLAVAAGLVTGLVLVVLSRVAARRFMWASRLEEELRSVVGPLRRREVLGLALLSGLGEETLFRGVLQPTLGLALTAALFGVLHIGPNVRFLPWSLMAFVAGLAFGGLALWTGSLLAPILAHATINFLNLHYLGWVEPEREVHLEPVGGEHVAGR